MRNTTSFSLLCFILFCLAACGNKKEKDGAISLSISPMVGSEQVQQLKFYENPSDGNFLAVDGLRFYLADIEIINNDGEAIGLEEVALYDLEIAGPLFSKELKAGQYNKLRFGLGVSSSDNASTPDAYPIDHPLGSDLSSGMYWPMMGYRFLSLVGKIYDDEQGLNVLSPLSYHTGTDALFQTVEVDISLAISAEETEVLSLNFELFDLLNGPANLDVYTENITHMNGAEDIAIGTKVMQNFAYAVER